MNYVPSAAAQVIVTIIPIVGIVMGAWVTFFYILLGYKSKKAMIEKGIYKRVELDIDTFSLFAGLILTSVGLGLLVFFFLKSGLEYSLLSGLLPFLVGVSLLLFFILRMKFSRGNG